jgi:hypothetical protein
LGRATLESPTVSWWLKKGPQGAPGGLNAWLSPTPDRLELRAGEPRPSRRSPPPFSHPMAVYFPKYLQNTLQNTLTGTFTIKR